MVLLLRKPTANRTAAVEHFYHSELYIMVYFHCLSFNICTLCWKPYVVSESSGGKGCPLVSYLFYNMNTVFMFSFNDKGTYFSYYKPEDVSVPQHSLTGIVP